MKHWAAAVEKVLRLALPWRVLRSQLVTSSAQDGTLNYHDWVNQLSVIQPNTEVSSEKTDHDSYALRSIQIRQYFLCTCTT